MKLISLKFSHSEFSLYTKLVVLSSLSHPKQRDWNTNGDSKLFPALTWLWEEALPGGSALPGHGRLSLDNQLVQNQMFWFKIVNVRKDAFLYKSALHGKSAPLLHRAWEGLRENCVSLFFLEAAAAAPDRHMGCSNNELMIMGRQRG